LAGGTVTYLAEVEKPVEAEPWSGTLSDHRLRQSYARPGGPAKDLQWARSALVAAGLVPHGDPQQIKTWNLSSVWRIPTTQGDAWLKVVPPFFAHESAMIELLQGERVPKLLGRDGERTLIAAIPGEDRFSASEEQYLAMVSMLVDLQRKWIGRTAELLSLGLPDWRATALIAKIVDVVSRTELGADDRSTLAAFVDDLPRRFRDLASCGLPDTLVHGDFHSGNVRGDGLDLTILDWGDSGVGHPLLDQPAFLDRIPAAIAPKVKQRWESEWLAAVPGSDPARAATLIGPVAAARQAVIYRMFLDNIEPAEHIYHAKDPADWLIRTAELVREGSS
jgi:hypothetical protein